VEDRVDVCIDAGDELFGGRRAGGEAVHDLALSHAPVLDVFGDHARGLLDHRSMSGIDPLHGHPAQPLEGCHVFPHVPVRVRDHGGPAAEDVIAGEECPLFLEHERVMIARVARRGDNGEEHAVAAEPLSVSDRDVVRPRGLVARSDDGVEQPRAFLRSLGMVRVAMGQKHRDHVRAGDRRDDRGEMRLVVRAGVYDDQRVRAAHEVGVRSLEGHR
jgi:hypothetical protein